MGREGKDAGNAARGTRRATARSCEHGSGCRTAGPRRAIPRPRARMNGKRRAPNGPGREQSADPRRRRAFIPEPPGAPLRGAVPCGLPVLISGSPGRRRPLRADALPATGRKTNRPESRCQALKSRPRRGTARPRARAGLRPAKGCDRQRAATGKGLRPADDEPGSNPPAATMLLPAGDRHPPEIAPCKGLRLRRGVRPATGCSLKGGCTATSDRAVIGRSVGPVAPPTRRRSQTGASYRTPASP